MINILQDRVHREIDSALADGEAISFIDRYRLPFTEAVILEAARMFPVVPLGLPHYARHESHLDLNPTSSGNNAISASNQHTCRNRLGHGHSGETDATNDVSRDTVVDLQQNLFWTTSSGRLSDT